ncbi:sodium:solute symporter family transporter [Aurantimonas coralicida]|uniref:sodium:solute symporter family transporter n=1 Tax=Aurantimonas coralicida TaxID=182270 RepID=UPI002390FF1F|nr:cation acetate symporter [Aurantimonas coralicida]MDE0925340.1 cation acetate symporter [Aurantimonas coralicida]
MAIAFFLAIILLTVGITIAAARRTHTAADFFVAGGTVGGVANGFAIAGDFMSAATLLGISAIIFNAGYDAVIYLAAPVAAFSILIFLMTDKLKELGRYTFTDIICARLKERPLRILAAITTLAFSIMYLMVQVVGAGALIEVLFGIDYGWSVLIVTGLMVLYVSVGGMLATTWVQITKAVMLLVGLVALAFLTLAHFDFDFSALYAVAEARHGSEGFLRKGGGLGLSTLSALSLGIGLCFGLAGSPHLLMRFFTVRDAAAARQSAVVAISVIAFVNLLLFFIIGVGAVALVTGNPAYLDSGGAIAGGANMVSVHLSHAVGGEIFFGVISAVAFATILAVVAGLTLAAVSAISHDLYANVLKAGTASGADQVRVSRFSAVVLGLVVAGLAMIFEKENIAYLVSLTLAIGASTNFPLLILSIYWRGLTTRGALAGGTIGLTAAILLMVLAPPVWVGVLGNETAVFPESYPALYSVILAFGTMFVVSTLDRSAQGRADRERFSVMTS